MDAVVGGVEKYLYDLTKELRRHGHQVVNVFTNSGQLAEELGLPFLGELPLDGTIRAGGDTGQPIAAGDGHPQAAAFEAIADRLIESLRETWGD